MPGHLGVAVIVRLQEYFGTLLTMRLGEEEHQGLNQKSPHDLRTIIDNNLSFSGASRLNLKAQVITSYLHINSFHLLNMQQLVYNQRREHNFLREINNYTL